MLGVNRYERAYVATCASQIGALVAQYKKLKSSEAFEQVFLQHAVLALDHYFMHRLRGQEGKDGNPLNEVRMISDSIMEHGGRFTANKTIKYDPAKSVLKLKIGEPVVLNVAGFEKLAKAILGEIEAKFC